MRKCVVGIVPLMDYEKESYWMLPGYMKGITEHGGIPLMLPLTCNRDTICQLVDMCDGFLFTGGQDVSPEMYGEEKSPKCQECCPERDKMEMILLEEALKSDKSILGICRGIQFINTALGGTLYQDLPTQYASGTEHHQEPPYHLPIHEVEIKTDVKLYDVLGSSRIKVNSCHHQAIRDLSPHLVSMAISEDGLVEGVYMPDKTFVWAVQWHPEFSYEKDEKSRKIFAAFVDSMIQ